MADEEQPEIPQILQAVIEHNREVMEKHQMHSDAEGHSVDRFLTELNEDQMQSMTRLLGHISRTDTSTADWYLGVINGLMVERYNYCLIHGVDHDKELAEMTSSDEGKE